MIRISTKGRYGTRLLINLARRYGTETQAVVLKEISDEEGISIRYLEQIIIPLKINRLVKSIRGTGGGYILSRPPEEIDMSEILQALEGNCCLVECLEDEDFCDRIADCPTYGIWKGATDLLKGYFKSITLKDIIVQAEKKKDRNRPR